MKIHNKPKKRFGQNFLQDENILSKIVKEINPQPDDLIIEIGPGYGALTQKLFSSTKNLIAVEIDNELASSLKEKFPDLHLIDFRWGSERYWRLGSHPEKEIRRWPRTWTAGSS